MLDVDLMFYRTAKKLGLPLKPFLHVIKTRRILANYTAYRRRCESAASVICDSKWRGFISKTRGFGLIRPNALPGIKDAITACQQAFEDKGGAEDPDIAKKPFLCNILKRQDLEKYPQLLDFALSRQVIEIVTDYLGMLPKFRAIGLYFSPMNESTRSSQMFHFDGDDFRQVKCFINVFEVDKGDGPFTFLPADTSRIVRTHIGHKWGDGRISDTEVFGHCSKDELIQLVGPAGSGAMVDTTNCLHFGSRARQQFRLVLMFQYTGFPDIKIDKGKPVEPGMPLLLVPVERFKDDPLTAAVLAGVD